MNRKLWPVLLAAASVLWQLASLGGGGGESFALERLRFAVPAVSSSVMPMVVARSLGYYREEGFEVQIPVMKSEIALKATIADSVAFSSTPGNSIDAAVRGVKLKILFAVSDRSIHDLMARPGVRSVADLKGKRVAISSPGSMTDILTRRIFQTKGLVPDRDFTIISVGPPVNQYAAVKAGMADATLLNPPYNFQAEDEGFTKLLYAGDYEAMIVGGVVSTDKRLREEAERVYRFIRGTLKGHLAYLNHREQAVAAMLEFMGSRDRKLAERSYEFHLKSVTREGGLSPEVQAKLIADALEFARLKGPLKNQEVFDFSLARRAAGELRASQWRP